VRIVHVLRTGHDVASLICNSATAALQQCSVALTSGSVCLGASHVQHGRHRFQSSSLITALSGWGVVPLLQMLALRCGRTGLSAMSGCLFANNTQIHQHMGVGSESDVSVVIGVEQSLVTW
jgi:hypothetical protein